jgi:hypothetical protein
MTPFVELCIKKRDEIRSQLQETVIAVEQMKGALSILAQIIEEAEHLEVPIPEAQQENGLDRT